MKAEPTPDLDENGEPLLTRAELEADLCRRIKEWARFWEKCPLAGCRRNARCLHDDDDCRAISKEPMTAEETHALNMAIGRAIAAEMAERGLS